MDYSVGSLADIISGKETPNKTRVVQRTFTPIEKDPPEFPKQQASPRVKTPKTAKTKFSIGSHNSSAHKNLTPLKKESEEILNYSSPNVKSPKKPKRKRSVVSNNSSVNVDVDESHAKFKDESVNQLTEKKSAAVKSPKTAKLKKAKKLNSTITPSPNPDNKSEKTKAKKRKVDESNDDIADHNKETTPKKQKLTKNEENAASRIRNKINQDTKNSIEYKERTIFVGNIPISITKKKIKKHFGKYGPIDTVRIRGIPVADPKTSKKVAAIKKEFHPDRNTVYAFVRFTSEEDAKKAEAENGEVFLEHHLRVHCCDSSDKPDEAKAIFVGNVSFKAEEEELWNLFKPCGPISHVRIVRDGRTGMGKGFAYINFKDADSVQLALEMEKVVFKDRELRISLCDNNRAKKKKLGKKPKNKNSNLNPRQANGDGPKTQGPKEKKFSKNKNIKNEFTGTKFNDITKKKKVSRSTFEKKKLAKKLVAPQPQKT